MRAATSTAAQEIKLIQIGRRALQLDEGTYRAMLANLAGGKTSSTQLTDRERQAVLAHMKASGFAVKPRADSPAAAEQGWQRAPQMRKLRAMWYLLAEGGHVTRPASMAACNADIEAWAKRQTGGQTASHTAPLTALRFATGPQMDKLVEALKAWCTRLRLALR